MTLRRVVVTGASRGIGLAIARRFLELGSRVVLHSRGAPDDDAVREAERQGRATVVRGDLALEADRAALFVRASSELGGLDVLVNNAAEQSFGPIREWSDDAVQRMFLVNVVAALDCMRRAAEAMAGADGDRCIVNIASIRATRPGSGAAVYAATKAALLSATRTAAVEYGPAGIRVNAISPGLVWREGLEREWADGVRSYEQQAPLGRIGRPEDVAEACAMLASSAARWITGVDLPVDGGISLVR